MMGCFPLCDTPGRFGSFDGMVRRLYGLTMDVAVAMSIRAMNHVPFELMV